MTPPSRRRRRKREVGAATPPAKPIARLGRRVPGLLIVEGDADTLSAQGHSAFADRIEAMVHPQVENGLLRLRRVRLRTKQQVHRLAADRSESFNAVVLLAHGSHYGVTLARDFGMDWRSAAAVLRRASPTFLLAISCNAGSASVTDILFEHLPSLERVVGSPETMTTRHAAFAQFELLSAVCGRPLAREYGTALNVLNVVATDGLLFTRTREEWRNSTPAQRALLDLAGSVAKSAWNEVLRGP